ncbi:MAG: 50S ribosomal protein L15 [Candidatus Portnoybacteria bacterium]|nr:50S ribosomal protein L15 [Candidatus Portnoybacteria bacterium]
MQLHQLIKNKNNKKRKRVGRGGRRGTYSGRGLKGQKSRAGAKIRPAWRDYIKQMPKKRGYRFKPVSDMTATVNLNLINKAFKEGEIVSAKSLLSKGIIGKINKGNVKILGDGEISKKLTFKDLKTSAGARQKIEKSGGLIQ